LVLFLQLSQSGAHLFDVPHQTAYLLVVLSGDPVQQFGQVDTLVIAIQLSRGSFDGAAGGLLANDRFAGWYVALQPFSILIAGGSAAAVLAGAVLLGGLGQPFDVTQTCRHLAERLLDVCSRSHPRRL
jgi:hypothetical protein